VAQELELSLPSRPESVAEARLAVGAYLSEQTEITRDSARVVVSELVTNAIKHGPGGKVTLRIRREGDSVHGEVEDEGDGTIELRREQTGFDGGFGLRVVHALTERWGVREGSTHVWFELSDRPG
jgi:anti-sigma regulatory factor (Ser/Thr protein kinase)